MRARDAQPKGDSYDVAGDGTRRGGWEKLMYAMLYSDCPKELARRHTSAFSHKHKLRRAIEMLEARRTGSKQNHLEEFSRISCIRQKYI